MIGRALRVLHLPVNIASIPSHTVRCLRQIGVEAKGLVYENSVVQSAEGLKAVCLGRKHYSPGWLLKRIYLSALLIRWLEWADVLHWYFGAAVLPWGLDLALIKRMRKPGIVEWMGSDIRIPEQEKAENPYYAAALENGYEYLGIESATHSWHVQRKFAQAGFACGAAVGMIQYVQKELFNSIYVIPQRLFLSDYSPVYPSVETRKPLLVHSPTAPVAKGTAAVLSAIEQLRSRYEFEFCLLQGLERSRALAILQRADIFLDQFVLGDRGMASLEAMALGKPVVCYIKPSLLALYPPDLPIVNATQHDLSLVLESLLQDPQRRQELGKRGRAYVEKYHDGMKIADQLKRIYTEIIEKGKRVGSHVQFG